MITKQKKNLSYNPIRNMGEDWALDERNGKPYSGYSVQDFIKRTFKGKGGDFYYDPDTNKYIVFADVESRELYLTDRETYAELVIGTFDAPANYTAEINMTTPSSNVILSGSTGNYIDFTFDVKSKSGSSTGESVVATFTFNNSGNIKKVTQVYNAGTSVHFLCDPYLSNGTNSVSIVITGRNTLVSAMAAVTYNVVAIDFTSTFDFSQPVEAGEYLSIPYHLEGAGVKYIEWYIDGVLQQDVDTVTDLRVNRTKNIETTGLSAGKHNVQARAYITNNGSNFYSKTLYYDFVVSPAGEAWQSDVTYVLLGLVLGAPATSTISVSVKQYEAFEYLASIYDSRQRSLNMVVSDNGTQVQSISMHYSEIESLSYSPTTTGNHTILFTADGATAGFVVAAESGDVAINEVTDALLLKLSAKGRNNNETNPAVWTYGGITTTFNNFAWNAISGWNDDALVIPVGSSIDINFAPLGGNPLTNGRTIEIDYETSNIENDDASVISIVNQSTNAGFNVSASTASLQSSGGANVNTKYKDGDRVHLAFIINKVTGDNGRLMFIVNNGILERAASFASTDAFRVDDNLHIGSTGCTIKIHSIRVYDRALMVDEAFGNYAVDSDNLVQIADRNDILNPSTGLIDADKVNAKIPIMIITGDMQPIFETTDKNTTVYVDVEYRNLQDASKNFFAQHLRMRKQGTSSLGYPRPNLRLYTSSQYGCTMTDANGDVLTNGLYAFKDKAQPVNCWTLKADYAESSGSHNTGVARMWNNLMYSAQINGEFALRTNAQKTALQNNFDYDVRTTIDGFPIVVFNRVNAESELVCLGQYNFNNDKSTESVFGFTGIPNFDDTHVQCFEFLENENPICLFDDVSNFDAKWDEAFESRYPDTKTPNLTPLKTLATWINACKNNQAKWNSEKASHLDLPKLAAYYVYLMRFGAVDQTVKNAMIETEDGVHWFFINYDNDTILGIDNISTVLNAWNYDRTTQKTGGAYYFAGHNSVLWNCFEADPECMAMVSTVDDAMYGAGLTYANMIKMFDEEQCDKWCERIYNDNGAYKYIQPFKESGSAVLYMLQGSRKSYRHWWLQHRMDLYDAKWATGGFKSRIVRFIAEGAQGGTFTVTAANTTYFGYGINSVPQEIGVEVQKNASQDFTITKTLAIGDPVAIYNANNASEIDLSDFITHLTTLYINQAVGNDGKSELKSLILGDGSSENSIFSEIGGLSVITSLEEIDIRGFKAITSIELSTLVNLSTFKAADSGLTSFVPATGCSLSTVTLPSTIQSISLNSASVASLTYTPTKTLRSLSLRNITGAWDAKTFVNNWLALFTDEELEQVEMTLVGINWTGMTVAQVLKLAQVGTHTLQGKVTVTSLTYEQYQQLIEAFGEHVFDPNGTFVIDAPDGIYFEAPSSIVEGQTITLSAIAFPIGNPIVYHLYDSQGTEAYPVEGIATLGGVSLNVNTGELSVGAISQDMTIGLRAISGEAISELQTCTVRDITTIGGFTLSGQQIYDAPGSYQLSLVPDNPYYNVAIASIEVQAQQMSELLSFTYDTTNLRIGVTVSGLPQTNTVEQYCNIVVTDVLGNVFRQNSVELVIRVIRVNDFTVSGPAQLVSKGTYRYTLTDLLPANHNKDIQSLSVVASPSTGLVISGVTNSAFNLVVTSMPEYTIDVTLTVVATLDNNTTVTKTKVVRLKVVGSLDILDEMGVAIMHKNGTFYTLTEWQNAGLQKSEANGIAISDAQTNPSSPHRVVALTSVGLIKWSETCEEVSGITSSDQLSVLSADFDGQGNTDKIIAHFGAGMAPLAEACKAITSSDGCVGYLPSVGELLMLVGNQTAKDWYSYIFSDAFSSAAPLATSDQYGADFVAGVYGIGSSLNTSMYKDRIVNEPGYYNVYIGIAFAKIKSVPFNKPIDLGLPSGKLWSNVNLGAASIEDAGLYYQWGNLDGHNGEDGYDFSTTHYAETPGSQIATKLPLANDAANDALGGHWRMPTADEFAELFNDTYTTRVWTTINGVGGWRITSKANGNSIFMPVVGYIDDTGFHNKTTNGYYWSSDSYNSTAGMGTLLSFNQNNASWSTVHGGSWGQAIRPIMDPPILVGDDSAGEGTHNYTIENLDNIASISASVSTPSSGSVSVSTSGTTTILNVAGAPTQEESVILTVVATLTDGSTWTITKSILLLEGVEYVDLGLPSGLLWCKHNLGATNPEDAGLFFALGETTGYADAAARNTALGRSDGFSSDAYTATGGAAINDSVLSWAHDAAAQIMGGDWRMPTKTEFQELYDGCNSAWVTENGVAGRRFTSKTNGNSIFFPAAGYYNGTTLSQGGSYGNYWSSSYESSSRAYIMYFYSGAVYLQNSDLGRLGLTIRPVCMPTKAIDLDLPSGTLWANKNLGAWNPEDAGLYFAWGETEGYKDAADRNAKLTAETGTTYSGGFDATSYNRTGGASDISGNLSSSNDAAAVNLGGSWRMPSKEDVEELINNTDREYTTLNGQIGWKFKNKNDSSIYVFFPNHGRFDENTNESVYGHYETSEYYGTTLCYYFDVLDTRWGIAVNRSMRYYGCSIRPVQ